MKKLRFEIELEYDNDKMHGTDEIAIEWFNTFILGDDELYLRSKELGDDIGRVRIISDTTLRPRLEALVGELEAKSNELFRVKSQTAAEAVEGITLSECADKIRKILEGEDETA